MMQREHSHQLASRVCQGEVLSLTLLVMHVTYRLPWSSKHSPEGRAMSSLRPQKGRRETSCPAREIPHILLKPSNSS